MDATNSHGTSLAGQMLVAMPGMRDPRFARTVIYMCAHSSEGAMGLVVNRAIEQVSFAALLEQLEIEDTVPGLPISVQFGGPVETGRGFVLHSPDYRRDGTLVVSGSVALTATIDIVRAIARGDGPKRHLLALGYSGWGPGQLDAEILANAWLQVDADDELVFGSVLDQKWIRAMAKLGIDPRMLLDVAGHA